MTIDIKMVNLYICCKCKYEWTNWDGTKKTEGPIPKNCPSCRNVRWNQHYMDDELEFIEEIEDQHLISKEKVTVREGRYDYKRYLFDFIAFDFLYKTSPQPDLFELRQVVAIPSKDVESRHELMLKIIHDRIENKEKYKKERFSGYGIKDSPSRIKRSEYIGKYHPQRRAIMKGCKHEDSEEIRKVLFPSSRWYDRGGEPSAARI
jgi:hypothetical protein